MFRFGLTVAFDAIRVAGCIADADTPSFLLLTCFLVYSKALGGDATESLLVLFFCEDVVCFETAAIFNVALLGSGDTGSITVEYESFFLCCGSGRLLLPGCFTI